MHDLVGDLAFSAAKLQAVEKVTGLGQRHTTDPVNRRASHQHMARFPLEAAAMTHGAGLGAAIFGQL
ncbi:hypothetical protein RZS08_05125, partial [Arthrospira platensis SPKY1]|nr:hypothetical protein [Arthrospira platensis SPKY1]